MNPAHGLVDHGGDDGLPVHRGPSAKMGGALVGVSVRGRCGAPKLIARGGKVSGDDGEPHRGLHRPV
jgi:hypothetical protein